MEKLYLAELRLVLKITDDRWDAAALEAWLNGTVIPSIGDCLQEHMLHVEEVTELPDETPDGVECPRCGEDQGPIFSLACEHLMCAVCRTPSEEHINLCTSCYTGDCESAAREG